MDSLIDTSYKCVVTSGPVSVDYSDDAVCWKLFLKNPNRYLTLIDLINRHLTISTRLLVRTPRLLVLDPMLILLLNSELIVITYYSLPCTTTQKLAGLLNIF